MGAKEKRDEPRKGVSKTTMLLGAAGLFLFIGGGKRSLRPDVGAAATGDDGSGPGPTDGGAAS